MNSRSQSQKHSSSVKPNPPTADEPTGIRPSSDLGYPDDEIRLIELLDAVWQRKWIALSIAATFFLLSAILAFALSPIYRVEMLLLPASTDQSTRLSAVANQFGGLASLAGIDLGSPGNNAQEAIAMLTSRSLLASFIEEKDLLPVLFADQWDSNAGRWSVARPDDRPTLWKGIKTLREDVVSVRQDPSTALITLAIEWGQPDLAAEWASDLVYRVNETMRAREIEEAEMSLAFLDHELSKTGVVELREAIYSLVEAQAKRKMVASVRDQFAFRIVDPARIPDSDDFVKPRRALMIVAGTLFGTGLGVAIALMLGPRRSPR